MKHVKKGRIALAVALAVVGGMLAGCASGGGGASPTLTLVTWGGSTQDGIKKAIADPFTASTGIKTRVTNPVDYGKYTAQIKNKQVTWDWADAEAFFIYQHPDYWAPIDTSIVKVNPSDYILLPGQKEVPANLIPNGSYSFAIAYRTDAKGAHPQTWADFFDTKKFPGKRAIYNSPYGMLEVALIADGVPFDQLYPLDVNRALKKLDTIKDDLVFWNSGAELQQAMVSGEAKYAFAWNNRIADIEQKGEPVALEWNQNLQDTGFLVTPKVGPHVKDMMKYFAFSLKPKIQRDYALATGYSPVLKSAMAEIPKDKQKYFNAYQPNLDKAIGTINLQWWADHYDSATATWAAWAGQ
ncbi:extracellular solute-binding protein [Lacisediminihabitans changchengi]|uniref:Extracellular solute-binding protein n=1 Tax=Lacisediminihabitans changchengi TaxID=2787634 RepID=A0A934SVK2_9MICO|nr:extracellular solute-binding protein [Lacisediminihabitans changchengi]MBK4348824.1 extracellular solute-binding protein [Lacisediminihabitans changchengi]